MTRARRDMMDEGIKMTDTRYAMELQFKNEQNAENAVPRILEIGERILDAYAYHRAIAVPGERRLDMQHFVGVHYNQGEMDQTGRRVLDACRGLGANITLSEKFTEGKGS